MISISTCLWFDGQAEDAAKFYTQLFHGKIGRRALYTKASAEASGQREGSLMTIDFEIANQKIMALNGGPLFQFTQAMSYFVGCETQDEIKKLWTQLNEGGRSYMALDKYPWAEMYGWTADRFGVGWQLMLSPRPTKIAPAFLFTDARLGKGQEAVNLYTSLFPNSKIDVMAKDEKTNTIAHCSFTLNSQSFALMEGQGEHGISFNEAFSLVVSCDSQDEIDKYWNKLTADGGKPVQCGWLKDKFGVSWQIVPSNIEKYAADPVKFGKAMTAVMKMVKLDMKKIDEAANS